MKLAIITALAFVLLIPISVFAQEPQSETIKEDSPIKYIVGIGLIFIIILAIIAGRYRQKFLAKSLASIGWTAAKKEKVRTRHD